MPSDLLRETLYPLRLAAKFAPRSNRTGRVLHESALYRWANKGLKARDGSRVYLEVAHSGGGLATSLEAVFRFLWRLSGATDLPEQREADASSTPRSKPRKSQLAAARGLDADKDMPVIQPRGSDQSRSARLEPGPRPVRRLAGGTAKLSRINVTLPTLLETLDAERIRFAEFAAKESEPVYRHVAADLYRHWGRWNVRYFDGRLREPHIMLGVTAPRSLGFCKQLTDFGASLQITINHRVIFGQHKIVQARWPSEGIRRFVRDILLHETVHQWQYEVLGNSESGYRGHGPHFCAQCNRIGEEMDLAPVVVRRRGRGHSERPLCSRWPQNVRPEGFYLGDIGEATQKAERERPTHYPDYLLVLEAILGHLKDGRIQELEELLEAEIQAIYQRRRLGVLKYHSIFTSRLFSQSVSRGEEP